jgi:DNA-binding transcriptional ArsR family regulator
LRISWPAVTKHLHVLERAGLLQRRRDGRNHVLKLDPAPMKQADTWISAYRQFWDGSFDALADYLRRGVSKAARAAANKPIKRARQ